MADHEYLRLTEAQLNALPEANRNALRASYDRHLAQQKEHNRREKEHQSRIDQIASKQKQTAQLLWQNAQLPGKKLTKEGDSAADHFRSVLNFQMESIAIAAIINIFVYTLRIALGIKHTEDCIQYAGLSKTYIPYDPAFHKDGIPVKDLPAGAKFLAESADGLYVPINFDPDYHYLFQLDKDGKPIGGWDHNNVPLALYPHSTDKQLIADNGYKSLGLDQGVDESNYDFYMPYDPARHRSYFEVNPLELCGPQGARLVTRQANGDVHQIELFHNHLNAAGNVWTNPLTGAQQNTIRLVPLNFDPRYHELRKDGVVVNNLQEAPASIELIRQNGFNAQPNVLRSMLDDLNILLSKVGQVDPAARKAMMAGMGEDGGAHGQDNRIGGYMMQQRPAPKPSH